MNLEELRMEVELAVDDPSYSPDLINRRINECVAYAAGLVSIPELKRIGTISTVAGQAWVSITSVSGQETFSGKLKKVKKGNGTFPTVYPDLERFMLDYAMDEEGEVEAVVQEGTVLWYARIPETPETLIILYFVNPPQLKKNEDIPSDFPEHVHRKLFACGTSWMIFDEIEGKSDLEGEKVNTNSHYWQSFDARNPDSGINQLRSWLARHKAHHISSVWEF